MKTALVFLACLVLAYAYPQGKTGNSKDAEIVYFESDVGDTNYNFKYETSDGNARVEEGTFKDSGDPENPLLLTVKGAYSYVDDEGKEQKVQYIADENGFRIIN